MHRDHCNTTLVRTNNSRALWLSGQTTKSILYYYVWYLHHALALCTFLIIACCSHSYTANARRLSIRPIKRPPVHGGYHRRTVLFYIITPRRVSIFVLFYMTGNRRGVEKRRMSASNDNFFLYFFLAVI